MKRILTILLLAVCLSLTTFAQDNDKALEKAAKNGTSVPVSTVYSDVNVDAVLIPRVDAERIFGKEIANNYAIIELNIGNKSPDSALLIQGVYIDYSRWAMSGVRPGQAPVEGGRFGQYQTSTNTAHVASNEYRVVRGQLLDAQNSTWRNRIVSWLTFAATLASAYDFSIHEVGIKTGIGKAGTIGIPGLKTAWPDSTIEQLNRVSDYGFRSGKSIPREGSDIIICFFPIDRFLTPGFKKLYLKSPALFFAPQLMLVDASMEKDVERLLGNDLGLNVSVKQLRLKMPCYLKLKDPNALGFKQCLDEFGIAEGKDENNQPKLVVNSKDRFDFYIILDYIGQMSLNNVNVTVDGVMTIDTSAFAAKIDTVAFDKVDGCGDDTSSCFWTDTTVKGGVRTGTISGSYMTGGSVVIAEADKLKLTDPTTVADGSNDQRLHFSFKLTQPIASGIKLNFTVSKTQSGPNATEPKILKGAPKEYAVTYTTDAQTIKDVTPDYSANPVRVTVNGTNFVDVAPDKRLKVTLDSPSKNKPEAKLISSVLGQRGQLVLEIPPDTKPIGCWAVHVLVGTTDVQKSFEVAPANISAAISGTQLVITGTDLDGTDCQASPSGLTFQLEKGNKLIDLTSPKKNTATEIRFDLPVGAGVDATWTLHIRFGGKEVKNSPMALH